jgi:hypothetical protein
MRAEGLGRNTMKTIIIAGMTVAALLATPAFAGINARQAHQQHRILQGAHSGELTRREAGRLERQQVRIGRREARMRASGGGLSPAERARLHYSQDRASINIYGKKHNDRVR